MLAADIHDLVAEMENLRQGVKYCSCGTVESASSETGIEVEGFGRLKQPLRPKDVRELIAFAKTAPYGKGTRTLVDLSVRNSLEINASKITLSAEWKAAVEKAAQQSANALGLPTDAIQPKLYKLLIYQKGGFFLPHRDSEKRKNMVASMVVMLPSQFGGGELVISHGESRKSFGFARAANGEQCEYVSFYADCLHEVKRVDRGVRVCLSYNLCLKPRRTTKKEPEAALASAIKSWMWTRPGDPMVFSLDHQYTANGLKLKLLKGSDRLVGEQVVAAAEELGCHVYLGQVSRHLLQYADEGRYGRGRAFSWEGVGLEDLQIGESYEDEVVIDGWRSTSGKKTRLAPMTLDGSMLISRIPLKEWKPTSFDYEGYTGNAGNTLDRWYHKSAIVIWPDSHHYNVLVRMGLRASIDVFLKELSAALEGLATDPGDSQAIENCKAFATAIVDKWPFRMHSYYRVETESFPWLEQFAAAIPKLKDADLLAIFLQKVAVEDWILKLDRVLTGARKHFDPDDLFAILLSYLKTDAESDQHGWQIGAGLPPRDAAWLLKIASLKNRGGLKEQQLSVLTDVMVSRVASVVKLAAADCHPGMDYTMPCLVTLMKAAVVAQDDAALERCVSVIRDAPQLFDRRTFDVKVCSDLIARSDKRNSKRPEPLQRWLDETREFLQSATESEPVPPVDFVRPSDVTCDCRPCNELRDFLTDGKHETGEIRARKAELEHVQHQIRDNDLDVNTTIDRTTRPFTLRLRKTDGSFVRAVKRYQADLKRLAALPD